LIRPIRGPNFVPSQEVTVFKIASILLLGSTAARNFSLLTELYSLLVY